MTDDFSNAPLTIGEIRARKTESMRHVSPRDILIECLREIDNGSLVMTDLVIVGMKGDLGLTYRVASPKGGIFALGMLTRAITAMQENG